jgi:hypothetical protein
VRADRLSSAAFRTPKAVSGGKIEGIIAAGEDGNKGAEQPEGNSLYVLGDCRKITM